jgi:hypothetical protein
VIRSQHWVTRLYEYALDRADTRRPSFPNDDLLSIAQAELGFSPSTSLEAGLQAEAEWLSTLLGTPLR